MDIPPQPTATKLTRVTTSVLSLEFVMMHGEPACGCRSEVPSALLPKLVAIMGIQCPIGPQFHSMGQYRRQPARQVIEYAANQRLRTLGHRGWVGRLRGR